MSVNIDTSLPLNTQNVLLGMGAIIDKIKAERDAKALADYQEYHRLLEEKEVSDGIS